MSEIKAIENIPVVETVLAVGLVAALLWGIFLSTGGPQWVERLARIKYVEQEPCQCEYCQQERRYDLSELQHPEQDG